MGGARRGRDRRRRQRSLPVPAGAEAAGARRLHAPRGAASRRCSSASPWSGPRRARRGARLEQLARLDERGAGAARRAGIDEGRIAPGYDADLVVWDPDAPFTVAADASYYRHQISPYVGAAAARARAPDVPPRARGLRRRRTSGRADRPRPAASGGRVSETAATAAAFTGLIDLAAADSGGQVLGASDDFFAAPENLLEPGRGVFIDGKYTDRGKWMDGWESRRKRGPGHDWCVLGLGAPGDGARRRRRHAPLPRQPPGVRVDRGRPRAARARRSTALQRAREWTRAAAADAAAAGRAEPVRGDAGAPVTHVRLNIFPDGGVARLRVYGRVAADWARRRSIARRARTPSKAASTSRRSRTAALALACTDTFFGPMNNLMLPGPGREHGRRLGDAAQARARPRLDPRAARRPRHRRHDRGRHQPLQGQLPGSLLARGHRRAGRADHRSASPARRGCRCCPRRSWPPTRGASSRPRSSRTAPISHVRLQHLPRRRRQPAAAVGHARRRSRTRVLNALSIDEARAALLRCCGATRWAAWLLTQRPFASTEALFKAAAGVWTQMEKADMLEAFAHHPEIGSDIASLRERFASTAAWSSAEQAGVAGADDATLEALRDGNVRYARSSATCSWCARPARPRPRCWRCCGRAWRTMPDTELHVAAAEQAEDHAPAPGEAVVMSPTS